MLSGETAGGKFPREAVAIMARTVVEAEQEVDFAAAYAKIHAAARNGKTVSVVEATVAAATQAAVDTGAKAIIVLAKTGATAQLFSKQRSARDFLGKREASARRAPRKRPPGTSAPSPSSW